MGDGTLEEYVPQISAVLRDSRTRKAVLAITRGCVPVPADLAEYSDPDPFSCPAHVERVLAYAKDTSVDTVVIGACWYCVFVDYRAFGAPGPLKTNVDSSLDSLRQLLLAFGSAGKRVYLVLDKPVGTAFDPRRTIRRSILPPGFEVIPSRPARTDLIRAVQPIETRVLQIAAETGARVIDPLEALCGKEPICPVVSSDGRPMYQDMRHLRASYVRDHVRFLDATALGVDQRQPTGAATVRSGEIGGD
jgi:hypothetical protein